MPAIRSNVIVESDDVSRQPRRASAIDRRIPRARSARSCEASARSGREVSARAGNCRRESGSTYSSTATRLFWSFRASAALGCTRTTAWTMSSAAARSSASAMISGVRCMIAANDFGHQGRRRASDGRRKGDPRARRSRSQNKLPYVQLVESAGANLHAAGGDVRARRRDFRQHGAPVGGRNSGHLDRARLLDRGRRLSDGPRRLCRDGARPLESLSRRAAAAEGRDRRDRRRRSARRRRAALRHDGPRRISRRGRRRRACASAARSSPASAGGHPRRAPARPRRFTIPRSCSGSCPSTIASPTTCAK